ncbi:MAG: PAS domain S-box protein [Candidatus Zixiibacteriota bacterium]
MDKSTIEQIEIIADSCAKPCAIFDIAGNIASWNILFEDLTEEKPKSIKSKNPLHLTHENHELFKKIEEILKTYLRIDKKDGLLHLDFEAKEIDFSYDVIELSIDDETFYFIVFKKRDIAIDDIFNDDLSYKSLIDSVDDAIVILKNAKIAYFNDAFLEIIGICREIVCGLTLDEIAKIIGVEHASDEIPELFSIRKKSRFHRDFEISRSIGSGKLDGYEILVFRDISVYQEKAKKVGRLNQFLSMLIDSADIGLLVLNNRLQPLIWNRASESLSGYDRIDVLNSAEVFRNLFPKKEDFDEIARTFKNILRTESNVKNMEVQIINKSQQKKFLSISIRPFKQADDVKSGLIILFRDITEERQIKKEKEKLIHKLQMALQDVEKLTGLLPICSSCKKIRNDDGYWDEVDRYISQHSNLNFTHGLCPECMKKLYPEAYEHSKKKSAK